MINKTAHIPVLLEETIKALSIKNEEFYIDATFGLGGYSKAILEAKKCKVLGNITMDSFVLDVTNLKGKSLKEGDYLCLLDNTNIKNIVTKLDIISYELLTIMGNRLLRKYNS